MSEETKTYSEEEVNKEIQTGDMTGKNSNDQTKEGVLKYPLSDINRYGARIVFMPKLITGPQLEGSFTLADTLKVFKESMTKAFSADDFADDEPEAFRMKGVRDSPKGPAIKKGINMPLSTKKIEIYLPISFNATDTMTYDSPSIGSAGAIIGNALDRANGGMGDVLGNAVGDFINLFKGAGATSANSLATLGAARLAKRGPTEVGDGVASSLRVTVDPNIRTLFRGVQVRQFAFQFKFIAKNSLEAKEIKDIIKRFRFYAYPESIGFTGSGEDADTISVGFKYPHPFEIKAAYMDAEGKSTPIGPLMKDSYLTSITTNYNPSTMAFHQDGEPVEIDLSLNFTEETTLNKKDILGGY